jgi:thiol-disulfide isomerase/thioredoxin
VNNRIRNEGDFHTALRLSAAANIPMITYWTASYCPPCRTVKPLLHELLQQGGRRGWNLQYAEVEVDAPEPYMSELAMRYGVSAKFYV